MRFVLPDLNTVDHRSKVVFGYRTEEKSVYQTLALCLPYLFGQLSVCIMRINEGGHFAPTGYLTRSGDFKEVYHGIEDIPAEHRIFAYPKLNIREQMAAYKEVIDRSSLEGERLHPRKEHDDR